MISLNGSGISTGPAALRTSGPLLCLALALSSARAVAAAPAVSFSATRLDFGNGLVGQPGTTQPLTLTNSGASPLLINSISFTGTNPGDFSISSDSGQATLAPGTARSLSVRFKAGATGARSAVLAVSDNASGSPHLVSLAGNGVTTFLDRSPRSVDLGSSPIGVAVEQTVALRNDGNSPLNISRFGLFGQSPAYFYWRPGPGYSPSLAPGASTSIIVGFKPIGPYLPPRDTRTALLGIWDDAPFSPHTVSLMGTAAPALAPAMQVDWDRERRLW